MLLGVLTDAGCIAFHQVCFVCTVTFLCEYMQTLRMSNSTTNFYDLHQSFSFSDIIVISTYFLLNLAVGIWVRVRRVDVIFPSTDAGALTVLCVSHRAG